MVILCWLAKKNQNLNLRKKSSVYYWKLRFPARNTHKPPFSVIKWTFFPRVQISIFLREATQNDHIRLLYKFENDQKKFGCVGSCGYAPASVKYKISGQKIFFVCWILVWNYVFLDPPSNKFYNLTDASIIKSWLLNNTYIKDKF